MFQQGVANWDSPGRKPPCLDLDRQQPAVLRGEKDAGSIAGPLGVLDLRDDGPVSQ
jgi:hypothetical protein